MLEIVIEGRSRHHGRKMEPQSWSEKVEAGMSVALDGVRISVDKDTSNIYRESMPGLKGRTFRLDLVDGPNLQTRPHLRRLMRGLSVVLNDEGIGRRQLTRTRSLVLKRVG
jgi:hypothetical protein